MLDFGPKLTDLTRAACFVCEKWSSLPQAAGVLTQRSLTLLESSFAPLSLLDLRTQVKKKNQTNKNKTNNNYAE